MNDDAEGEMREEEEDGKAGVDEHHDITGRVSLSSSLTAAAAAAAASLCVFHSHARSPYHHHSCK